MLALLVRDRRAQQPRLAVLFPERRQLRQSVPARRSRKSIVALTMTLVIISGEIDLSVASVMGLAACVMAWMFHDGAPMPLAIAAGAGLQACSPGSTTRSGSPRSACRRSPSRSRASSAIAASPASWWRTAPIGGFPDWFNTLGQQPQIGPLTVVDRHFLRACSLSSRLSCTARRSGRLVYVVGNNVQAARYSGVRVGLVKIGFVRRLGLRGGARGNSLCCATGIGARRHGGGVRARHHHRRAAGRGQHFRRQGQSGRGRPFAPCHPEPSQRNGSCRHHRQHPERA